MNTGDFPGENDFSSKLINELKYKNLKYIACPYPFIYPFDSDILKFLETNESKIPCHIIDVVLYKYLLYILKGRPYTGTCAIIDLLFIGLLSTYKLSAVITRSIESSYKNNLLLAGFIKYIPFCYSIYLSVR